MLRVTDKFFENYLHKLCVFKLLALELGCPNPASLVGIQYLLVIPNVHCARQVTVLMDSPCLRTTLICVEDIISFLFLGKKSCQDYDRKCTKHNVENEVYWQWDS